VLTACNVCSVVYEAVGRSQSSASTSSLPVMSGVAATPGDRWRTTSCRSLGIDNGIHSPTTVRTGLSHRRLLLLNPLTPTVVIWYIYKVSCARPGLSRHL